MYRCDADFGEMFKVAPVIVNHIDLVVGFAHFLDAVKINLFVRLYKTKVAGDKQLLENYVVKVLNLGYVKDVNEDYYTEIYKKLTDEEMIYEEQTKVYSFLYNDTVNLDGIDFKYYADKNKINLKKYHNKNLTVFVSDIINFVTGNTTKKIFVFDSRSMIMADKI